MSDAFDERRRGLEEKHFHRKDKEQLKNCAAREGDFGFAAV